MKICSKCKVEKPYTGFSRSKQNKDGYHWHCKECCSARIKAKYAERGRTSWLTEGQCSQCDKLLPKTAFGENRRVCKQCLVLEAEQLARGIKRCNSCREWLPLDQFAPCRQGDKRTQCRACASAYHNTRIDKNRDILLRREYGITAAQYDELVAKQNGKCPVCEETLEHGNRSYPVDHAHGGVHAGRIRAIVCTPCNRFVLWTHEDSKRLRNAANLIENPLTDWFVPGPTYNESRWKGRTK